MKNFDIEIKASNLSYIIRFNLNLVTHYRRRKIQEIIGVYHRV